MILVKFAISFVLAITIFRKRHEGVSGSSSLPIHPSLVPLVMPFVTFRRYKSSFHASFRPTSPSTSRKPKSQTSSCLPLELPIMTPIYLILLAISATQILTQNSPPASEKDIVGKFPPCGLQCILATQQFYVRDPSDFFILFFFPLPTLTSKTPYSPTTLTPHHSPAPQSISPVNAPPRSAPSPPHANPSYAPPPTTQNHKSSSTTTSASPSTALLPTPITALQPSTPSLSPPPCRRQPPPPPAQPPPPTQKTIKPTPAAPAPALRKPLT